MPGPKPHTNSRRRNAPTITADLLPAEGRSGRPPAVPKPYKLGAAGRKWWTWAWRLPQATRWDAGTLYFVLRRAQLEDDLSACNFRDELDLEDLFADADPEAIKRVKWALESLKRMASGSTTLMKEMRELDNRLGLNPKSMTELRWTIADPAPPANAEDAGADVAQIDAYRARVG